MNKRKLLTLAVATAIAGTTMLGVTSATPSTFMQYDAVAGTITICDPNDDTKCIVMQDKNLGATKAGTGCSAIDTGACGNHYQWGNNHGFEIGCFTNGCSDTVTNSATSTLAIWSGAYNYVGYVGTIFITNGKSPHDYWSDETPHNGLWGGIGDLQSNNRGFDTGTNMVLNVTGRKGPCPDGYHVPSAGERGTLLKYWVANYTGMTSTTMTLIGTYPLQYFSDSIAKTQFQEDFKIPFAGIRRNADAKITNVGSTARLWSSSPRGRNARYFYMASADVYANSTGVRARAISLRCFKDSYLSFQSSEGGEPQVIVNIGEFNGGKNTCTGENYIFSGIVAGPSLITRALTKTFQCAFGESRATSVTIQLSGDLVDANGNTISSGNVKIKNSAWTSTPTGVKSSDNVITEYTGLNKTVTLFNKAANIIGTAVGNGVDIQLEILGGTPDGTYNGTLVLTY